MRKTILATAAALAVMTAATLAPANAMSLSAPAGVQAAIEDMNMTQDAAYVCRRVWTGYGWRRSCYWTGPRRGYWRHRPYRGYRRW
jgi:hypothetical protein